MSDPREVLESFFVHWCRAYAEHDVESMAALYDAEALFFGSTPDLRVGPSGVRSYFEALAPQPDASVVFRVLHATAPAPGVVEGASIGTFARPGSAGVRIRFTHTLVRRGGTWLASAHHASPAG